MPAFIGRAVHEVVRIRTDLEVRVRSPIAPSDSPGRGCSSRRVERRIVIAVEDRIGENDRSRVVDRTRGQRSVAPSTFAASSSSTTGSRRTNRCASTRERRVVVREKSERKEEVRRHWTSEPLRRRRRSPLLMLNWRATRRIAITMRTMKSLTVRQREDVVARCVLALEPSTPRDHATHFARRVVDESCPVRDLQNEHMIRRVVKDR